MFKIHLQSYGFRGTLGAPKLSQSIPHWGPLIITKSNYHVQCSVQVAIDSIVEVIVM